MPKQDVCGRCGQPLKSHDSISVANVGLRCYRCFNEETAAVMGVDFDNTPLQPVTVSDADGIEHTFEFRSMLVPTGHALHARERVPKGQKATSSPSSATSTPTSGTCSGCCTTAFSTDSPSATWSEESSVGESRTHVTSSAASPGILTARGRSRCW